MNKTGIGTASTQVLSIICLTALGVNVSGNLPGYAEPAPPGENSQPSQPVEGEQQNENPQSVSTSSFMCGVSQGNPATVAQTPRGIVPVIVWNSNYFSASGFNPTTRCQKVSTKFQSLYVSTRLNFITAGTVNNLQVICATDDADGSCNNDNILFTLKPGESALQVIKQLREIRVGAGGPLHESTRRNRAIGSNSVDVNDFLNNAPVDSGASVQPANRGMLW